MATKLSITEAYDRMRLITKGADLTEADLDEAVATMIGMSVEDLKEAHAKEVDAAMGPLPEALGMIFRSVYFNTDPDTVNDRATHTPLQQSIKLEADYLASTVKRFKGLAQAINTTLARCENGIPSGLMIRGAWRISVASKVKATHGPNGEAGPLDGIEVTEDLLDVLLDALPRIEEEVACREAFAATRRGHGETVIDLNLLNDAIGAEAEGVEADEVEADEVEVDEVEVDEVEAEA